MDYVINSTTMKISFVWQGVTEAAATWDDGLWAAMKILETQYEVEYVEPWGDITGDVILYWEAPCTINGDNQAHYNRVRTMNKPRALLFAGGPIEKPWVTGFDLLFLESRINEEECDALGIPHIRAFGVNTAIFKPESLEKTYDAMLHGTFAGWKRQTLFAKTFGTRGLAVGKVQAQDRQGYVDCQERGVTIVENATREEVATLLNQTKVSVNCAEFWGGGQRATLEAMACDVPVICMTDSPKNAEYIEEAGVGLVVPPEPERILAAWERLQNTRGGRDYVLSKWTPEHYATNLIKGICTLV